MHARNVLGATNKRGVLRELYHQYNETVGAGLTDWRCIFLIWYSAEGTNEVTVMWNSPLVSVLLVC